MGKELSRVKSGRQLTDEVPGYLKILFSEFEIFSRLSYSLWALQHNKQLTDGGNPFVHIRDAPSAYLSVDSECAALLLQLNRRDAGHLPRLLNVGTVGSDG